MSPLRILALSLLSTTALCSWQALAVAADLPAPMPGVVIRDTDLPAVSGINGKLEIDPGIINSIGGFRGAGSLSIPVGKHFGLQLDASAIYNGIFTYAGAAHAFTRDPSSYLAGVTAGFVKAPGATLAAVGPEVELYHDQFSLEAWAGIAGLNYVDPALLDKTGLFAIGDVAYYATPDWRFALGGSYILGDGSLHLSTEYQFHDLGAPLSLTADARLHVDGNLSVTVGLKGYLGGDDNKTLIDRNRQDDPPNRSLALFLAAGSLLYITAPPAPGTTPTPPPPPPTYDTEAACLDAGGIPIFGFDGESVVYIDCEFAGPL